MLSFLKFLAVLVGLAGGFVLLGVGIRSVGALDAETPRRAAEYLAHVLRGEATPGPTLGTAEAADKNRAQVIAATVASWLRAPSTASVQESTAETATGLESVNRAQWAALTLAGQLRGVGGQSAATEADQTEVQFATQTLAEWLNGHTSLSAARTTEAESSAQVAIQPAPAGAIANSTIRSGSATANKLADGLQDRAGALAGAASKEFGDILKKLPDTSQKAPSAAPAPAGGQAPSIVAQSGETPETGADLAADIAVSSLRYEPAGSGTGAITISGRGIAGRKIAVYLDATKLGTTMAAGNGHWLVTVPRALSIGQHVARADLVADGGKPGKSALYPFARQAATVAGQESLIVPLKASAMAVSGAMPDGAGASTNATVVAATVPTQAKMALAGIKRPVQTPRLGRLRPHHHARPSAGRARLQLAHARVLLPSKTASTRSVRVTRKQVTVWLGSAKVAVNPRSRRTMQNSNHGGYSIIRIFHGIRKVAVMVPDTIPRIDQVTPSQPRLGAGRKAMRHKHHQRLASASMALSPRDDEATIEDGGTSRRP